MVESECLICSVQGVPFLQVKDYNRHISAQIFLYHRCPSCGLIYLVNVPKDLERFYSVNYYAIPSLAKLKRIASVERFKIEMIKKYVKTGSLLEIGSAFGVFAYQAKKAGFSVDCIEMNERCCKYLKNEIGVNVLQSDLSHKAVESMRKHDVIAMWHVLEHLDNPWGCLNALADNLSSGGILVIATPNPQAFQFRILGKYWPHIDAPRHLNLIPQNTLAGYLNRFGLERIMLTTNDKGGRAWNKFGWQRYLMNCFSGKIMQGVSFLAGYLLSFPMSWWDQIGFNGSAYTVIFRKKGTR